MIFSWTPEAEMVHSASHQPDLSAQEALNALEDLSSLMLRSSDRSFRAVINIFSFIVRLGRIPIRRHEGTLLRSIHDRVRLKHEQADYDSPYFKIFLLLQAHFSRLPLTPELTADLTIALERVFSLFSLCVHHDWSGSDVDLDTWLFQIFILMRMCVHSMWAHDTELQEIPHLGVEVSCSVKRQCLWLIHPSGYQTFQCSRH
jgi:hypothetical protein